MKAIIFGTGAIYQKSKKFFVDVHIICFLDNDATKWGQRIDGIPIDEPGNIDNYNFDYVFLASMHFAEMRAQLLSLKVPEEKVIDINHLGIFKNLNQIRRYEIQRGQTKEQKGKILLISHALNLSGAPVVLEQLARVFHDRGYFVEVYAQENGQVEELLYQLLEQGIPVSLYARLEWIDINMVCDNFDMVVVNTIVLYPIVQKLSGKKIPVIWWLHEEEDVYQSMQCVQQKSEVGKNVHVYAVGNRAKRAYEKYSNNQSAEIMLYGIRERAYRETAKVERKKMVFALIGYGCERKGQDIVYEVMDRRYLDWIDLAEVWLIGEISESKRKNYSNNPCIFCKGVLSPDELMGLYDQIDVLLCPSLHDPMPVVVSEAMMHKKPCIVSDRTGQHEFIIPYVNGLTCEAGVAESLEKAMEWAIKHRSELDNMGMEGYRVYKEYFSLSSFENKVDEIVAMYLSEQMQ